MITSKLNLPLDIKNSVYWNNNWNELRDYILYSLGYPIIRIELTQTHLNLAIRNAVSAYLAWEALDIYSAKMQYDADGYVIDDPNIIIETALIHDVVFEGGQFFGFFGSTLPMEGMYLGINQPFLLADFDLVYYWQQRSKLEDMNQLLNLQKTWEILDGKIKVYPLNRSASGGNIAVLYCPVPSPSILEQDNCIQEMSVAEAKIMLGTIRGKFSSYTVGGSGTQTDGETIKNDGKEDKRILLEEIKSRRRPLSMSQF